MKAKTAFIAVTGLTVLLGGGGMLFRFSEPQYVYKAEFGQDIVTIARQSKMPRNLPHEYVKHQGFVMDVPPGTFSVHLIQGQEILRFPPGLTLYQSYEAGHLTALSFAPHGRNLKFPEAKALIGDLQGQLAQAGWRVLGDRANMDLDAWFSQATKTRNRTTTVFVMANENGDKITANLKRLGYEPDSNPSLLLDLEVRNDPLVNRYINIQSALRGGDGLKPPALPLDEMIARAQAMAQEPITVEHARSVMQQYQNRYGQKEGFAEKNFEKGFGYERPDARFYYNADANAVFVLVDCRCSSRPSDLAARADRRYVAHYDWVAKPDGKGGFFMRAYRMKYDFDMHEIMKALIDLRRLRDE